MTLEDVKFIKSLTVELAKKSSSPHDASYLIHLEKFHEDGIK